MIQQTSHELGAARQPFTPAFDAQRARSYRADFLTVVKIVAVSFLKVHHLEGDVEAHGPLTFRHCDGMSEGRLRETSSLKTGPSP